MECIHPRKNVQIKQIEVTQRRPRKECSITKGPTSVSVCSNDVARVTAHNGLMVVPTIGTDNLTVSGAGTRMFFYAPRGAFRSGNVNSGKWNVGNLGMNSFASGFDTEAVSDNAHAEGRGTRAGGLSSHAEGDFTIAEGNYSHSEGGQTRAYGVSSHAEGEFSIANGQVSHVEGQNNYVNGRASHVEGWSNTGDADSCHVEGYFNQNYGTNSHVEGEFNYAESYYSHTEGSSNYNYGDYSHVEGYSCESTIDAPVSFVHGQYLNAQSEGVFLIGQYGDSINVTSSGATGIATGAGPYTIDPTYSFQIAGGSSVETGGISVIMGTRAFGENPVGGGISSFWQVRGSDYAEYFEWDDSNPDNEDRIGYFVELTTDKIKKATDSSKVLGITSDISGIVGDAAELAWNGFYKTDKFLRTKIFYSYKSSIIRYLKRLRNFAQEDLAKINTYEDTPEILSKILCDIPTLQQYIGDLQKLEPIPCTVPSEAYDPSKNYIPRSQRKEWIKVGLVGKIPVRDNGNCEVGGRCDCENGIAIPGNKWHVMKRLSVDTILVFFS